MKLPKRPKKPDPEFILTASQMHQFFSERASKTRQQRRNLLIIAQMALLGLRPAEICALDARSLERFKDGHAVLHIPETTGGTERQLSLDKFPVIVKVIQRWIAKANVTQGVLFWGDKGYDDFHMQMWPRSIERLLACQDRCKTGSLENRQRVNRQQGLG